DCRGSIRFGRVKQLVRLPVIFLILHLGMCAALCGHLVAAACEACLRNPAAAAHAVLKADIVRIRKARRRHAPHGKQERALQQAPHACPSPAACISFRMPAISRGSNAGCQPCGISRNALKPERARSRTTSAIMSDVMRGWSSE